MISASGHTTLWMDTVVTARGFCRTELLQLPERGHAARLYAGRHKASQRRAARRPGRKPRRIAARRKQVKKYVGPPTRMASRDFCINHAQCADLRGWHALR